MSAVTPDNISTVVDAALFALANDAGNYIQDQVLPRLDPPTTSGGDVDMPIRGKIIKVARGALYGKPRDQADLHAPASKVPVSAGVKYNEVDFRCETYARAALTSDYAKMAAKGLLTVDQVQADVEQTVQELLTLREARVLGLYGTVSNWAHSIALVNATDKWSDKTNSDPVTNIDDACVFVQNCGVSANAAIITQRAFSAMRRNRKFLDNRSANSDNTLASEERVREILAADYGIRALHIAKAVQNTGNGDTFTPEPLASADFMWIGCLPLNKAGLVDRLGGFAQRDGQLSGIANRASATYLVRAQDWASEPVRDGTTLANQTTISYVEAMGVLQAELGCVIHGLI